MTSQPLSSLNRYRLLGKSGLRVSPLCLGTMTFGGKWNFTGKPSEEECEKIFEKYVALGGNFIDTANCYHDGESEKWLGTFITKRGIRDDLVIATKYSLPMNKEGHININHAGNHRKNMFESLEASLKRLQTNYIDLYYVHFWDYATPTEEIMRALDDLVRSGKVNYVGISDAPAWEVSRAQTLADLRGYSRFIAYQSMYSLSDRDADRDILPMSLELGLGVVPFNVLSSGKLTGKYKRGEKPAEAQRQFVNPTERDYTIVDEIVKVADEIKKTPAQVAINWVLQQPGITSPIIGARTLDQFNDNIGALNFTLSSEYVTRLHNVSKIDLGYPHSFLLGSEYFPSYKTVKWTKAAGQFD